MRKSNESAQPTRELSDAEMRDYEAAAEARYRDMTGMDLPREERAARAHKAASHVRPLTCRAW